MEKIVITWESANEAFDSIIEEFGPQHHYVRHEPEPGQESTGACLYVDPESGQADCIIGKLLARHGYPLDVLGKSNNVGFSSLVHGTAFRERVTIHVEVAKFLDSVQRYQDCGEAWGQAVRMAREEHEDAYTRLRRQRREALASS